ncbi:chemotaxis protein CheW [Sphingobium phenoxybenzoativorans]|uniref:chemotaxis protein CheW n=1 Tax=Sphingobium phenoxybenzoativorans TaxID=1592790 RepID=UPI000872298C|nr:CheW domain-containing protein [Sphingobium phenoxybenzoativorans]
MNELYLFAHVAGTAIAVKSTEIEAVVKVTEISPVPGMPVHIAGLSALRSRVLTMVDIGALIHGRKTSSDSWPLAIVADISGHSYGLMVDSVSDICTVPGGALPLRGQLDAAWAPYAQAIVENEGNPYLLVSLAGFIEPRQLSVAA